MAKNDNMLAILWMLHSGRRITAKEIAEKLEINIRTVYRYIDSLSMSGVPILSDTGQNGGYSLQHHFFKAPLIFDREEQQALLQAAEFAEGAGYPLSEPLSKATHRLKLYMNQEQEQALQRHLKGFEVVKQAVSPASKAMLTILEESVAHERAVEMLYRSKRDEQPQARVMDPYGILYWNNRWYVVGYCHLREEIRSFRIDRMIKVDPTEQYFRRPDDFSAEAHFLEGLLPDTENMPGAAELVVRGKEEALDDLCSHWFMSHHLKARATNKAVFVIDEGILATYVPYFFLPYGKALEVVAPSRFKQQLVATASDLLEYYQK